MSPSVILPLSSPANVSAFMRTRSTTPVNALLLAEGQLNRDDFARAVAAQRFERALEAGAIAIEPVEDDDARQVQAAASAQSFSVCTSTPATASTTTRAASTTRSAARASVRKLANPGVSMMLILAFCHSA